MNTQKCVSFCKAYKEKYGNKKPIFICIGNPKVTGDSLGPRIGNILQELGYKVCGTMKEPILSAQFDKVLELKKENPDIPFIAIDAAIGKNMWRISYDINHGLCPGNATGHNYPEIGDCSLILTTASKITELYSVKTQYICSCATNIAVDIFNYIGV